MEEQDWTPSKVMHAHLQNLVSLMTATELTTCHVPEDPTSPVPIEGYVVAFVAFYMWGFGAPSHQFLCSLLQPYSQELHNLILSEILQIMAFVTLCEAYIGIDPHFDLWNNFFCIQRSQDEDAEIIVSRGVVIHAKSGHGVDPYFNIPMPKSMKGWRKSGST
jgi:hypothetical protein